MIYTGENQEAFRFQNKSLTHSGQRLMSSSNSSPGTWLRCHFRVSLSSILRFFFPIALTALDRSCILLLLKAKIRISDVCWNYILRPLQRRIVRGAPSVR